MHWTPVASDRIAHRLEFLRGRDLRNGDLRKHHGARHAPRIDPGTSVPDRRGFRTGGFPGRRTAMLRACNFLPLAHGEVAPHRITRVGPRQANAANHSASCWLTGGPDLEEVRRCTSVGELPFEE